MNPNQEPRPVWWLRCLLMRTFFTTCRAHNNNRRNDLNVYCIDCQMAACQNCRVEGNHRDHRTITIYRLVYREVVTLNEMDAYLDCDKIQPYMSNGREVLALHPLPHCGSGKLSRHLSCRFCTRKLMDPKLNRYCSIACKYRFDGGRPIDPPSKTPASNNGNGNDNNGGGNGGAPGGAASSSAAAGGSRISKTTSHHRNRKNIAPTRAHLF